MFASRVFQLVILAVAVLCVAQGTWWDEHRIPSRAMIRRQDGPEAPSTPSSAPSSKTDDGDNNQPASSTSSESAQETSSSSIPDESSSVQPQPSETSVSVTTSSEGPQSSTNAPSRTTTSEDNSSTTSSIPEQSTTAAPSSSTTTSSQSEVESKTDDSTVSQSVSTSFSVSTKTNSDGTKETHTSKTLVTLTPGLTDENDNGSSGMSPKTRNTIIGVVVGVGGAIVLGALGLVAWRIWGRKKQAEENDGLMAYDNGYSAAEKSEPSHSPSASTSRRDPFQSTLENYHQPTPVNASSNF